MNIHKAGYNDLTGADSNGNYVSRACFTISRDQWDSFINIFNTPENVDILIGVSVAR